MKAFTNIFRVGIAAVLAAVPATSAFAQAPADLGGSAVAGLCVLARDVVFADSAVGKVAFARFGELQTAAETEISTMRSPIEADVEKLRASAATMKPDQLRAQEAALQERMARVQSRGRHLRMELDATRAKLIERLNGEMLPVISTVYAKQKCGLLIDRSSVIGGNMANDLTAAVVSGLDARISTISFNREILPQGGETQATPAR